MPGEAQRAPRDGRRPQDVCREVGALGVRRKACGGFGNAVGEELDPSFGSGARPAGGSALAGSGTGESGTLPMAAALGEYLCWAPAPLCCCGMC